MVVYNQVIDHKNRVNWSPWSHKDPEMTKGFEGPESGVGAVYTWSGNDEVGTGSLKIVEAKENAYIKNELVFTEPFESKDNVEWMFEEKEGKTNVVWLTSGELPKIASMFMDQTMEQMLGPDFEKGLEDLKTYCEKNYVVEEPSVEMEADSMMVDSSSVEEEM